MVLAEVCGTLADAVSEKEAGELVHVVQMGADHVFETGVIIDIEAGEILGVEE